MSISQGSDFTNIYIRSTEHPLKDAENDRRLADELRFVKFSSIAWTHDNKGFFYQACFLFYLDSF
jgi:prolyl oligopeptidase